MNHVLTRPVSLSHGSKFKRFLQEEFGDSLDFQFEGDVHHLDGMIYVYNIRVKDTYLGMHTVTARLSEELVLYQAYIGLVPSPPSQHSSLIEGVSVRPVIFVASGDYTSQMFCDDAAYALRGRKDPKPSLPFP